MRTGRTLAPAAASISWFDIGFGLMGWFAGSSELKRFSTEIENYFSVKNSYLVCSGRAALTLTLQALKDMHPNRDEVLIPAFTCYSVPAAIVRAGLKVRLCDVDPDTLDFDFAQLGECLPSQRLLAVIPCHLFGNPADIASLRKTVHDPQVVVIEDAAQSFGGRTQGQLHGTIGDVGVFSLGRGKALSTVEGGIIITRSPEISRALDRRYRQLPQSSMLQTLRLIFYALALTIFLRPSLFWLPMSIPFLKLGETLYNTDFKVHQLSPFQAGLSRHWQERLTKFQNHRVACAKEWAELLSRLGEKHYAGNSSFGFVRFPWRIRAFDKRGRLLQNSLKKGLGITAAYPAAVNMIPELDRELSKRRYPAADELSMSLVTLPVHSFVTISDRARIVRIITDLFGSRSAQVRQHG